MIKCHKVVLKSDTLARKSHKLVKKSDDLVKKLKKNYERFMAKQQMNDIQMTYKYI